MWGLLQRAKRAELERFSALHKVFVISAGRTGTNFLGLQLGRVLPDTLSVHEPDRLDPIDWRDFSTKLIRNGPGRSIVGKLLGMFGTRNLSLRRIEGSLGEQEMLARFVLERRALLAATPSTYVEANPQLYGLAGDLARVPNTRIAVFVRDPRTWVPSWMGKRWFGQTDWTERIGRLGLRRLNPRVTGERDLDWKAFSPLERLCWTWTAMNRRLVDLAADGPSNVALFRYEDVFARRKPANITSLMRFVSPAGDVEAQAEMLTELLSKKINRREARGPRLYESWSEWERGRLQDLCSDLAGRLGYDLSA